MTSPGARTRWAGAVVALLLAAAGCADTPPWVDRSEHVVEIRSGGCSLASQLSNGVVVSDNRVLTVAHSVAGAAEIDVTIDGTTRPAVVDVFDPETDIAVLAVTGLDASELTTRKAPLGAAARIGDSEIVAEVERRLIVGIEDIYVEGRYERRAIELDASVAHGQSGSPVFDRDGYLVGLVYATSRGRAASFALDAPELDDALLAADGAPSPNGRCP